MIEFLTITSIIILAAISPGPDFAMVIKNSLSGNRKAGILTALGVSLSIFIHSIYAILGLALIVSQSLFIFNMIKYLGAAYLIYIGIKCLLSKDKPADFNQEQEGNQYSKKAFVQGVLCNLLNPKAIMFILAFFSIVVNPATSYLVQFGLSVEIALIHFIWFSCLALIITNNRVGKTLNQIQKYITKTMGLLLVGFGARIAFFI